MQTKNYSFRKLPFTDLFKSYTTDFKKLSTFYETNPFDAEQVIEHAESLNFGTDRSRIVEALRSFNKNFKLHKKSKNNLNRLRQDDALTIVTGQQLGLYGGPLYTVFKTISAIHLANQMEEWLNRPVVPVFWLADEDHDYEEVRTLNILNRNKVQQFELPPKPHPLPPVADIQLPAELSKLKDHLRSALYDTEFSDGLWTLLDDCFKNGQTYFEAFGQFISSLFSKHGVVLAGSNHSAIKEATKSVLKTSVSKSASLKEALTEQTKQLKDAYRGQVTLYNSNLFWFSEEGERLKINHPDDGKWTIDNAKEWSTDELLQEIEEEPARFSPNVFLRPVLQDELLPTLGYVAGPGEVAYYGQMKHFYTTFNKKMPVIYPRMSGTFIEPTVDRIWKELPFNFSEYSQRIEDLESSYVEQSEQADLETLFSDWKQEVEEVAASPTAAITEIDASLEGAAEKAKAVYFGELDKLKGKVYRAVKQRDQTQLNRIRKVKTNLFPENSLQERLLSPIYYMNKFGLDIWDELLDSLDKDENFDEHKLIEL